MKRNLRLSPRLTTSCRIQKNAPNMMKRAPCLNAADSVFLQVATSKEEISQISLVVETHKISSPIYLAEAHVADHVKVQIYKQRQPLHLKKLSLAQR